MALRLLSVPAHTYLYLCRAGKHYLECYEGAIPADAVLLNLTAENGYVKMTLESKEWEEGSGFELLPLPEPRFRVLTGVK